MIKIRKAYNSCARFIKGLAANKGWSRPGFCLGLISLLSEVRAIETASVLAKMRCHLDEAKDKDNVKGIIIGRAFCLAALIKSQRATESAEIFAQILGELFKILRSREYLRQLVVELVLEQLTTAAGEEIITAALRDNINEQLTRIGPELTTDPDLALLLFRLKQLKIVSDSQFRVFWGSVDVLCNENGSKQTKNFEKLKTLLNSATKRHPKRHPLVDLICSIALKSEHFAEFWKAYEKDLQRLTWEKKFVAMDGESLPYCIGKLVHIVTQSPYEKIITYPYNL